MTVLGQHLMFRSDDDRVLAPSAGERRAMAQAVYRVSSGYPLLCFGAAHNHLHVELLADRATAGRFAHALMCSLHWALDLPVEFAPVRYKPIESQSHKRSTFHYALGQRRHHGVQSDPFLDASSLPELLGMRLLPTGSVQLAREHLPRLRREDLLPLLGIPALAPANDELLKATVEAGRVDLLRDAAAGTLGLASLDSKQPPAVAANRALVHTLEAVSPPRLVGSIVERSSARIRHMRAQARDPRLEQALRLQLSLRLWLLETQPELMDPDHAGLPQASTAR